ncbi:hypothetical protein F5890DRAFT_1559293 [Lentinula detonsa]|uniref:Uncharacterized protein n=1 Tax=Lentinula detonsa TaxID=2804962 RepID=A0AA38PNV7_9AGAR|nr:hypothetical protein F5890DRAFT_1559293 [Lentinula detonsa]
MVLRNVVTEYMAARALAFKESTILASWRKSGIHPMNPDIFSEADFAPSITTSTQLHWPSSFPPIPDEPCDIAQAVSQRLRKERAERAQNSNDSSSSDSDLDSDIGLDTRSPDDHMSCSFISFSSLPSYPMQSSLPSQPEGGPSFFVPGQRNSRNSTTLNEIHLQRQLAEWKRRALVAEGQVMIEQAEREAATVHAVFAGREASILKYQLNANTQKKTNTSKCFTTSAQIVTSAEGKEQAIAEASKRDAKKNELEEKKKKKQDTERADFLRCAEQEHEQLPFSGSLRSKLKAELQDILFALGLNIEGNVAALLLRINAHFDTETALKQDPRYIGLFSKPSGKWKQAAEDHSETMQPSPPIHHSPSPIHSQPLIPPRP